MRLVSKYNIPLVLLSAVLILASCKKKKEADAIPTITFEEYKWESDTELSMKFHFIDGDGDVGFNDGDTLAPYDCQPDIDDVCQNPDYYNVIMTYYEFEDGSWIVPMPQPLLSYRISSLTPVGQDKYLEGDVTYSLNFPLNSLSDSRDSIKFDIILKDRALNTSNILESPLILVED